MKKLVAFALILSLGMLTLGCTPDTKKTENKDKNPPIEKKDKAPGDTKTPPAK
jgi:hypothetical protein